MIGLHCVDFGIVTLQTIKANTEVTVDYGTDFVGTSPIRCLCGAKNCRGVRSVCRMYAILTIYCQVIRFQLEDTDGLARDEASKPELKMKTLKFNATSNPVLALLSLGGNKGLSRYVARSLDVRCKREPCFFYVATSKIPPDTSSQQVDEAGDKKRATAKNRNHRLRSDSRSSVASESRPAKRTNTGKAKGTRKQRSKGQKKAPRADAKLIAKGKDRVQSAKPQEGSSADAPTADKPTTYDVNAIASRCVLDMAIDEDCVVRSNADSVSDRALHRAPGTSRDREQPHDFHHDWDRSRSSEDHKRPVSFVPGSRTFGMCGVSATPGASTYPPPVPPVLQPSYARYLMPNYGLPPVQPFPYGPRTYAPSNYGGFASPYVYDHSVPSQYPTSGMQSVYGSAQPMFPPQAVNMTDIRMPSSYNPYSTHPSAPRPVAPLSGMYTSQPPVTWAPQPPLSRPSMSSGPSHFSSHDGSMADSIPACTMVQYPQPHPSLSQHVVDPSQEFVVNFNKREGFYSRCTTHVSIARGIKQHMHWLQSRSKAKPSPSVHSSTTTSLVAKALKRPKGSCLFSSLVSILLISFIVTGCREFSSNTSANTSVSSLSSIPTSSAQPLSTLSRGVPVSGSYNPYTYPPASVYQRASAVGASPAVCQYASPVPCADAASGLSPYAASYNFAYGSTPFPLQSSSPYPTQAHASSTQAVRPLSHYRPSIGAYSAPAAIPEAEYANRLLTQSSYSRPIPSMSSLPTTTHVVDTSGPRAHGFSVAIAHDSSPI